MKVGIVGLGLIGGSLAKGYKRAGVEVFGLDKDILTQEYAQLAGAIDGSLDDETVKKCDLILIAITPRETVEWFKKKSDIISPETVVIDCCGTKRFVCRECAAIAEEKGIVYMGGHPMAGKEKGGFKRSSEDLFRNAPFILVPENTDDINLLMKIKGMIMLAGFGRVGVTTACEHDRVIAFTSQMPHILSNAFIKSKTALIDSQIISAGSYQDFTRVAYLDEKMWSGLFLENRDNLLDELRGFMRELSKYEKAMEDNDREELENLLGEGKRAKEEVLEKCGPAQINGE